MAEAAASPLVDAELAGRFALAVIELFQVEQSLGQLQNAVCHAFQWADYCIDLMEKASPLPQPLACESGCYYCCHNQVEMTAPEALVLAGFLAAHFSPDEIRLVQDRAANSLTRQAGKSKIQLAALRAEFPCPLLADGLCSVYEVRPLMCRAMHSLQAEACRQELADPNLNLVTFYDHRHVVSVSLSQGLIDACRALGYQSGPVNLVRVLGENLAPENLVDRWLRGEEVFQR